MHNRDQKKEHKSTSMNLTEKNTSFTVEQKKNRTERKEHKTYLHKMILSTKML
jgi:hypothetical protein